MEPLKLPAIDYVALAPMLILFGVAAVFMGCASIFSRRIGSKKHAPGTHHVHLVRYDATSRHAAPTQSASGLICVRVG